MQVQDYIQPRDSGDRDNTRLMSLFNATINVTPFGNILILFCQSDGLSLCNNDSTFYDHFATKVATLGRVFSLASLLCD
jgi:hypothetical protein